MPADPTEVRQAEIEALLEVATSGPWHTNDGVWLLNGSGTSVLAMKCDRATASDFQLMIGGPGHLRWLLDELRRTCEALMWYANEDNYLNRPLGYELANPVELDAGTKARRILEETQP